MPISGMEAFISLSTVFRYTSTGGKAPKMGAVKLQETQFQTDASGPFTPGAVIPNPSLEPHRTA